MTQQGAQLGVSRSEIEFRVYIVVALKWFYVDSAR